MARQIRIEYDGAAYHVMALLYIICNIYEIDIYYYSCCGGHLSNDGLCPELLVWLLREFPFTNRVEYDVGAGRIYLSPRALDHLAYFLVSEKAPSMDDGNNGRSFGFNRA